MDLLVFGSFFFPPHHIFKFGTTTPSSDCMAALLLEPCTGICLCIPLEYQQQKAEIESKRGGRKKRSFIRPYVTAARRLNAANPS